MSEVEDDTDRLIQEVLAELGLGHDAASVASKVRQLNRGLPAEDEFTAICAWLGQAELIHKLDQLQAPQSSRAQYQVPDLLIRFADASPVLIEVKVKNPPKLSFRPDYLRRLQAYADMLGLPLLIAWKIHGLWTLFEARHLQLARTNYNIAYGKALQENLLGLLAGDAAYTIEPGSGIHLRFRKEQLLKVEDIGPERMEEWQLRLEQVDFTGAGGSAAPDLDADVQALFATWDLDESQSVTDTHLGQSFVARAQNEVTFGHMALTRLLEWTQPQGEEINWRHVIRRQKVLTNMDNFRQALERGMAQNVVRHVLSQRPHSLPSFLNSGA